jgi:hypothetical protein
MGEVYAWIRRKELKREGIESGWFARFGHMITSGGKSREIVEESAMSLIPVEKKDLFIASKFRRKKRKINHEVGFSFSHENQSILAKFYTYSLSMIFLQRGILNNGSYPDYCEYSYPVYSDCSRISCIPYRGDYPQWSNRAFCPPGEHYPAVSDHREYAGSGDTGPDP